jgi:hypothetical protein
VGIILFVASWRPAWGQSLPPTSGTVALSGPATLAPLLGATNIQDQRRDKTQVQREIAAAGDLSGSVRRSDYEGSALA